MPNSLAPYRWQFPIDIYGINMVSLYIKMEVFDLVMRTYMHARVIG